MRRCHDLPPCCPQTFGRTPKAVKEAYDEEGDLGLVAEMSRSSQGKLAFGAKPKPLLLTQVQCESSRGRTSKHESRPTHVQSCMH